MSRLRGSRFVYGLALATQLAIGLAARPLVLCESGSGRSSIEVAHGASACAAASETAAPIAGTPTLKPSQPCADRPLLTGVEIASAGERKATASTWLGAVSSPWGPCAPRAALAPPWGLAGSSFAPASVLLRSVVLLV